MFTHLWESREERGAIRAGKKKKSMDKRAARAQVQWLKTEDFFTFHEFIFLQPFRTLLT